MHKQHKSYLNWSGGKDSALALHDSLQDPRYKVERLLTNINKEYRRVSMHGVREELVDQQAKCIGLPLQKLVLPEQPTREEYDAVMMSSMQGLKEEAFTHAFFGDIFLEDLKKYREAQLAKLGFKSVFPLWKRDTKELLSRFIDAGFKAVIVCIAAEKLPHSFAGRLIDKYFIKDVPAIVDACGEHGEFHSFVFDGPIFAQPVQFKKGEIVFREYKAPQITNQLDVASKNLPHAAMGFWFCDLLPVE